MLFELLIIYQVKHWVCDYPLQSRYMLGKFKEWPNWVLPLLPHSAVHGAATYVIAYCVRPDTASWLALFDLSTHFIVDRIKASPSLGGKFKALSAKEYKLLMKYNMILIVNAVEGINQPTPRLAPSNTANASWTLKQNVYFWWLLGLDQMAHHLTHYFIIWQLVR